MPKRLDLLHADGPAECDRVTSEAFGHKRPTRYLFVIETDTLQGPVVL
jgi:hypothetical protein